MPRESVRSYFEAIAARGRDPSLEGATGTWVFDLGQSGTWSVLVDDGLLSVREMREGRDGAGREEVGREEVGREEAPSRPMARLTLTESDFVRLARGDGHENVITAAMRGAVAVDGDIRFAQRLQAVLPLANDTDAKPSRAEGRRP